ncbi:prepilin peptidase [Spirochaeta cellobiosiphila]|uniref:prepilin peptidase n=1 Tax=Spirochaeta cellobiosiphila TaxID=504483 RepID=UPI00048F5524|nr:prepilin peptidase [Spirochaeta cellobiosiphila]
MNLIILLTIPIWFYLAWYDIKYMIVPDKWLLSLVLPLLLFYLVTDSHNLVIHIVSLLLMGGSFLGLHFVSKGKLGLGDVKLVALMAGFLNVYQDFILLFCASLSGLIVSMFYLAKKERNKAIPFAPFLSIGWIVAIFLTLP